MQTESNRHGQTMPDHESCVQLTKTLLLYEYALTEKPVYRYARDELFQHLGMTRHSPKSEEAKAMAMAAGIPEWQIDFFCKRSWIKLSDILMDALYGLAHRDLLSHRWYEEEEANEIIFNPLKCLEGIPRDKEELKRLIAETRYRLNDGVIQVLNNQARDIAENMERRREEDAVGKWGARFLIDDLYDMIDADDSHDCCAHGYDEDDDCDCDHDEYW